jgi:hypothetical protein
MNRMFRGFGGLLRGGMISFWLLATAVGGHSQAIVTNDPPFYGPFDAAFLSGGEGLTKPLGALDSVLLADSPWSLHGWVKPTDALRGPTLVAGVGDPEEEFSRYLAFDGEQAILWMGKDNSLAGPASLAPGKWHFLAATFDGEQFRLYSDGVPVASGKLDLGKREPGARDSASVFAVPGLAALWRRGGFADSGAEGIERDRGEAASTRSPKIFP